MKAFQLRLFALLNLLPAVALYAGSIPANYPKDLLYKGKPIDTLCLYETQNANETIPLATCGVGAVSERKAIGQNRKMIAQGYVGYDYNMFAGGSKSPMPNGYSYYKVIGSINNIYIISAINNSGGSGQFTAIYAVKREGDTLHLSSMASGDRCNNGIVNARVQDQQLLFTTYITPYDFLIIANQNPYNLNGYNDLDSCATCCQAKASYIINLNQDANNLRLSSVDLAAKINSAEGQSSFQLCFNQILNAYQAKGENHLDEKNFNTFVRKFNEECVRKDA